MSKVSEAFALARGQSELDFVDIDIDCDTLLFVDPLGLSQRVDAWSIEAHQTLVNFFQEMIDRIRSGRTQDAQSLLSHLSEPNETRLGFSRGRPNGAGIGGGQAFQIYSKLAASSAVQTGFITSLQDCELMIDGISHDKISDLTTNVIRKHLVDYTKTQCDLHGIPMREVAVPPMFDPVRMRWYSEYVTLPVAKTGPVLLVPKGVVRRQPSYDSKAYYNDFVIEFLRAEALEGQSGLVTALRDGRRVVYKKDIKEAFPFAKEFLFTFSRDHPEVLEDFRDSMKRVEQTDRASDVDDPYLDATIADALATALRTIKPGGEGASTYHSLMVGALEFLLYPHLGFPKKEREIHEGRKRIDIVMENCARSDLFFELSNVRQLPCSYVPIECKNYSTEVANPELDQLAGRFSVNRGMFGFLCCRHFEDRATFIKRCQDTFTDRRELIVALDDATLHEMLDLIARGNRPRVIERLRTLVAEVWL